MAQEELHMPLKKRCERIREIDDALKQLFKEQYKLYHDGLTIEQHNKLHDMVMSDGESHFS